MRLQGSRSLESRKTVLAASGWQFFGGGCGAVDDMACRGLCEELVERLALVGVERGEHLILGDRQRGLGIRQAL
jgi:hypothetical protein